MSKRSKLLALILRHDPAKIGLSLGPGGWVPIDDLLRNLDEAGRRMSRQDLNQIVADNDKKRFTISTDGKRIRAAQGHSIEVDLGLTPQVPPQDLFHGTARTSLDSIFSQGLEPRSRLQVHLSPDRQTAIRVGQRHGSPVVLKVDTGRMHDEGCTFWQADNGVWLTDYVDPRFLTLLDD